MKRLYLRLFFPTLFGAFLAVPGAEAQTCRVSMGVNQAGVKVYREVYEYGYVTDKPTFPGGDSELMSYINKNRHYPAEAYRKGIQGRVSCSFIVNEDGSVSHLRVIKGVEESLNREALRLLSQMPDWKAGRHHGRAVPVRVVWSVPFRK